ncbi:hypothetical protein F2P81_004361 [Scophthalmus maximus]|uniref:Uncharacterized protein n=1 Tax=Scophthalmus maximus TaxID=52904 RepID=A0A6A4TII9_SCOMX|nr:hypothetical protein F2P81_004361 [Scophthalmus maximus]
MQSEEEDEFNSAADDNSSELYMAFRLSFSLSLTSVYFNVIIPQHVAGLRENVRCDSSDVEDKIPRSVYTCVHVCQWTLLRLNQTHKDAQERVLFVYRHPGSEQRKEKKTTAKFSSRRQSLEFGTFMQKHLQGS